MPLLYSAPPRDQSLGLSMNTPGYSCADIKKWGSSNLKSGVYWIKIGNKGLRRVYCDMEFFNGGWTLFFNYKYSQGMEFMLDSQRIPENLDMNSHMYLSDVGYSEQDVKEVRFFCTEKFRNAELFWHFTSDAPGIIDTALTGNQLNLKVNYYIKSFLNSITIILIYPNLSS
jgi:Fibrinogen beta and gamma chains, C-terminal globular domain